MTPAEYRALTQKPKRSKYGNRSFVDGDGVRWHSVGEYRRYCELHILCTAGAIRMFSRQVRFALHAAGGKEVGSYIADFVYTNGDGTEIVEDFKPVANALASWKIRHMKAEYDIKVLITGHRQSRRRAAA